MAPAAPIRKGATPARRPRRRRNAAEARLAILDAAERRLIEGGPGAIRVQAVARDIGITDAAIHYHFGSQDGLIEALIRHAGRRLKERVTRALRRWDERTFDVRALIDVISETYGTRGYARLAAWMMLAGWQTSGAGLYRELAETIHAVRARHAHEHGQPAPALVDTQHAIALLNLVLFGEALAGGAMRRSVALSADRAAAHRFRDWLATLLEAHLAPATT